MPPSRESPIFTSIGFSPVPYRVIPPEQQGHTPFLILTGHHGNILALVSALDNCRIYRRLNRGMRYTLSTRRADNKVRLRRQGNRGRIPRCSTVSGMQNSVEHRNSALLLPTESGEKRYRARFDQKDVDRVVLSYRRSASRQKPMPAPDGKLKCVHRLLRHEIEK